MEHPLRILVWMAQVWCLYTSFLSLALFFEKIDVMDGSFHSLYTSFCAGEDLFLFLFAVSNFHNVVCTLCFVYFDSDLEVIGICAGHWSLVIGSFTLWKLSISLIKFIY